MQKESGVTPQALRNMPVLPPELVSVYNAFNVLSQQRGQGMSGEQKISIADIAAYLAVAGETCVDCRKSFMRHIVKMDSIYFANLGKLKAANG